jgi:hypothetical protein
MKPLQILLLVMLTGIGVSVMGQHRLINNNMQELKQRFNVLQLTEEQKQKLAILIRRERMQFYLNQKALNNILTEKQKAQLLAWRKQRDGIKVDSTGRKN